MNILETTARMTMIICLYSCCSLQGRRSVSCWVVERATMCSKLEDEKCFYIIKEEERKTEAKKERNIGKERKERTISFSIHSILLT